MHIQDPRCGYMHVDENKKTAAVLCACVKAPDGHVSYMSIVFSCIYVHLSPRL